MTRWRRAHRRDGRAIFSGVLAAVGAALLLRVLLLIATGGAGSIAGLVVILAVLVAWCLANWRLFQLGLATSDRGVRIHGALRTTTLPWTEFDDAVLLVEEGLFGTTRQGMWLLGPDGQSYATPVVGEQSSLVGVLGFLGYRVHLRPDELAGLAERLRALAAEHR